jgi:hypothetical protein
VLLRPRCEQRLAHQHALLRREVAVAAVQRAHAIVVDVLQHGVGLDPACELGAEDAAPDRHPALVGANASAGERQCRRGDRAEAAECLADAQHTVERRELVIERGERTQNARD